MLHPNESNDKNPKQPTGSFTRKSHQMSSSLVSVEHGALTHTIKSSMHQVESLLRIELIRII